VAITIIKGGKNEFVGHCKWCGCDFRYTANDVMKVVDEVFCPQGGCGRGLKHWGEHGTSTGAPPSTWLGQAVGMQYASTGTGSKP
jgi:hypothetical protein